MKRLALLLFLAAPLYAGDAPPYKAGQTATDENFRDIYEKTSGHRHNRDGSERLQDTIPDADSLYDLGAVGTEWANLYVDTITATSVAVTSITLNGLLYAGNPVGTVVMYVSSTVTPSGWLHCDGSSVSTTTYTRLFAIIGYTYGGSGANFALPDFRGVFPKGQGTTNRAAGVDASSNAYSATIGTYSQDKMQGHWHRFLETNTGGVDTTFGGPGNAGTSNRQSDVAITSPVTDGTNGTPRTGHTTEPQSLGIGFIIYAGI